MARPDRAPAGGLSRGSVLVSLVVGLALAARAGATDDRPETAPIGREPSFADAEEASGAGPLPARADLGASWARSRAVFTIRVDAMEVPLRVMAVAVVPGQTVSITGPADAPDDLRARAGAGSLRGTGSRRWEWTAPARGFHAVHLVSETARDSIQLTFMVATPSGDLRDGRLMGYSIGIYRARPPSMSDAYDPPAGFVEVRPEHHDILVSPNFRLGQFLCKQPGNPRFVLVSGPLLVKLEVLLEEVNEAGIATPTLSVMSGFRTPAYNRAIGNTTDFSRHLWGDAADVFVDSDLNGSMDDVNGDGRVDVGDARWLAGLMEDLMTHEPDDELVPGGLAVYRANDHHGPFVHVDARGQRSRW